MDTSRRSSRAARASQPSHHSSTSSNSSGRADRATRSHHKAESPGKMTPSGSLSSEPLEGTTTPLRGDEVQTRRNRSRGEERDNTSKLHGIHAEMTNNGIEEDAEDDEAVRCICGFEEYPGPPQIADDDSKQAVKQGVEKALINTSDVTEDLAGFFLQCDVCKVWQHGGCVGIMNEDSSPDEYFCEECRKDLHRIHMTPNGQRYSHYLPLYLGASQTTSRAASFSKDSTRSPRGSRSGRLSSSLQSAKRRSTMNSRDAAYDEEEQLRRAIEASKGEKSGESTDGGTRRGKRGRSDSEERPEGPKRRRTVSTSPSPSRDQPQITSPLGLDDDVNARNSGLKKVRGAAARNHKEKELREERERSRQDARKKREGRAERRRADESSLADELPMQRPSPTKSSEVASQPLDLPESSQVAAVDITPFGQPHIAHRKGGRPPNSRKGKIGKNQYTKEKDLHTGDGQSPVRSQSWDVRVDDHALLSGKGLTIEGKLGKLKNPGGSKVTMSDMRRRVAAILAFISGTQLEMAGCSNGLLLGTPGAEKAMGELPKDPRRTGMPGRQGEKEGETKEERTQEDEAGEVAPVRDFKDLSCMEMMDALTRQLVKWQKEFD